MRHAIERAGDRRGRADLAVDDDDVLRRGRTAAELRQQRPQRLARVEPGSARGGVALPAERVRLLLEPELPDVARNGRLRDAAARGGERVEQLLLRPELPAPNEAQHELLAVDLREAALGVHGAMFAAMEARRKRSHVAEGDVDGSLRRVRGSLDDGRPPAREQRLARGDRRRASDEEMTTKADQAVESAADKLDAFVREAQASGGVKAKVGQALADDPEFLRKLKPSLIKARATGGAPVEPAGGTRSAPSGPQLERPQRPKGQSTGGTSPWLVVGAALAAGYLLAKIVDWRGHAHPRL